MLWRLVARASIAPGIWWHQDNDGRLSVWSTDNQRRALGLPAASHPILRTSGSLRTPPARAIRPNDVWRLARNASALLPPGLVERESWRLSEGLRAAMTLLVRLRASEIRTSSVEAPTLRGLVELARAACVTTTYVPHAPVTIYPESVEIPHGRTLTTFAEDVPILRLLGHETHPIAHTHRGFRPLTERTVSTVISVSPWGERQIERFLENVRVLFEAAPGDIALSSHPRLSRRESALLATSKIPVLKEPLDDHLASGGVQRLITWSSAASRTALLHDAKVISIAIWPWRHYRFEYNPVIENLELV